MYLHFKSRAWGANGRVWDSKNQLAKILNIDERVLRRLIDELMGFGLILETEVPETAHVDPRSRANLRAYLLLHPSKWRLPPNDLLKFDGTYRKRSMGEVYKNAPTPPPSGCKNVPTSGCKNVPTPTILEKEDKQRRKSPLKGRDAAKLRPEPTDSSALVSCSSEAKPQPSASVGSQVWQAYSQAMQQKWNYAPPRNAKVSSQAKQLVELVGADNALALARYFPTRADRWYVEKGHAFGILLTDYPKLLRDVSLGFKVTPELAKNLESTQNTLEYMDLCERGIIRNPFDDPEPAIDAAPTVGELGAASTRKEKS